MMQLMIWLKMNTHHFFSLKMWGVLHQILICSPLKFYSKEHSFFCGFVLFIIFEYYFFFTLNYGKCIPHANLQDGPFFFLGQEGSK